VRVLVTGGAGFVGSSLCVGLRQRHPDWEVLAFDNLHRRGSELNLPRLHAHGASFVHGDVRSRDDLDMVPHIDAIVECSAEPSVMAGRTEGASYVYETNLGGAVRCLELARRDSAQFVFLSTSRVYPLAALCALRYTEGSERFLLSDAQAIPGASAEGVSEDFPLEGARTLYGATKLAAELMITEYAESFALHTVINRCGVIAGPWQMGKVDQGVFTFWLLFHYFGRPLQYIGFGGSGKQVRDLIHVDDVVDLVDRQLGAPDEWAGVTANVGGGLECSLSLRETTERCRELTGRTVPIEPILAPRAGDIPVYVSDCRRLYDLTTWRPRRSADDILEDTYRWIRDNEALVERLVAA